MLPQIASDTLITQSHAHFLSLLQRSQFSGEIRTDYGARLAVATDNSIYQVIPQAVIFPKSTEDIVIALTLGQEPSCQDIRFAARGGGTGTNGQSLSAGIIMDCSKYLNGILEINLKEQWVRVQAGVVLDQLNDFLRLHGLYFAPEISTSNRATLGGMINTDACGMGSKILGRTSDHVMDLTCILPNGQIFHTNPSDLDNFLQQPLIDILLKNQKAIHEKFTEAPRTLNGYNLLKAYQNHLNLNYLICGSEGTLAMVSECQLKLTTQPQFKKLILIKYQQFADALRAKEITQDIHPFAIETLDEKLVALALMEGFQIAECLEGAKAVNLVEFIGDDEAVIDNQIKVLCHNITMSRKASGFYLAKNDFEIQLLWELRKKAVGLISKKQDGTRRPIPFIEDTAVPPEHLADYIAEFKSLLDKHQLVYGMYGHIDAGCVHVRPALDLRGEEDEGLIQSLSKDVVQLVKKYNGVIWGEHGKGFRTEFGLDFFGETLYEALQQIKTIFDPQNKLNPGKIARPIGSSDPLAQVNGPFRGLYDKQINKSEAQEFASPLACNGNGQCFNYHTQEVMCPSFKVTKDRIHSPKGRATLVREWLRQLALRGYGLEKIPKGHFLGKIWRNHGKKQDFSHEVYAALNGCLSCKACTHQCPLNVDVPDFKAKFLSAYHQRYSRPLRDHVIANTEYMARIQGRFPIFFNTLSQNKLSAWLLKSLFKLVDMPEVAVLSYKRPQKSLNTPNPLIIVQDAFTSFYEKNILAACSNFFSLLGFSVFIAPYFPSGKPHHVKGFLKRFNELAEKNIKHLRELAAQNVPLIGIDPSITLTYRDEYQALVGKEPLGFHIELPQEFLQKHLDKLPSLKRNETYYLLSHCTEKTAQKYAEIQWISIFNVLNLTLIPLQAGCCGMAGSYGHELEHQNNSRNLFDMDWNHHLNTYSDNMILATGYSCRSQVKRFKGIHLKHPLEILLEQIKENNHELS